MLLLLFDFSAFTSTTFFFIACSAQEPNTARVRRSRSKKKQPSSRTYFSIRCSYVCWIWLWLWFSCLVLSQLFVRANITHSHSFWAKRARALSSASAYMPYEYNSLMCAYYLWYLFVLWIFFLVVYYIVFFFALLFSLFFSFFLAIFCLGLALSLYLVLASVFFARACTDVCILLKQYTVLLPHQIGHLI